jgi:tetratricopeptide (TPR) repeat protein
LFITNILNGLLSIENAIWFSYLISIFALVYLIPYISNTLILLTPSRILDILAENITEDQLKLAAQRSKTEDYDDNDPIHPIIDIVSNSLINYDHQTAKKGLTTIEKSTEILKFGNLEEKNFQKISLSIIHHLANVGKLAVKKEDEEFALEILQNIEEIGTESVYQRIGYVSTVAVESITQIGKLAIEQKIPYTAIRSLDLLDQIWETLNREKTKRPIIHTLEFENIKFVIPKIAVSIEEIRKLASENNIKIVLDEAEILSKKVYRDLKIEPNNEKNWNNIIWTLKSYEIIKVKEFSTFNESNSNRYDEALGILYKVPEISKNVDTFILEGDIHQKQGKDEEALASYNKATEKEPNSVAAWIFKGNLHLKLREFSNSLNAYERALDVKQDEPFIWYSKGSVFFELNQYDEALFACGKAIAIDKNYENARILKEAILNEQADKNNADFL